MPEYPEKNFSEQRKGPTNQPPYGVDAVICAPATLVGGGCSQHYVTLAPLSNYLAGHATHLPRQKNQRISLV